MFDPTIRAVLQHYTTNPPSADDQWYGPWNSILTTLFPSSQGYIVEPRRGFPEDSENPTPNLVLEVLKSTTSPLQLRTVLIVKVKNSSHHWQAAIPSLERLINHQTEAAFRETALSVVYWIGVIGPHWQYGVREGEEQDTKPLIAWHDTTDDQASYNDLQDLTALIAEL